MATTPAEVQAARERILAVLERVVGYRFDPGTEELGDLDSLHVLELLVSLEEEFDIDSDLIIESRPDWWFSLGNLAETTAELVARPHPAVAERG